MKKFLFAGLILMMFAPVLSAQTEYVYNPNKVLLIADNDLKTNEPIPGSVITAMKVDFSLDNPATWTKFPVSLKAYGWRYNKNMGDSFKVTMHTTDGFDLSAIYSTEGTLISTREVFVNVELPSAVTDKIEHRFSKEWVVTSTMETILYHHNRNSVEQQFRVTISNGKIIRTISFNDKATDHNPKN
jgi:hypothetical protein